MDNESLCSKIASQLWNDRNSDDIKNYDGSRVSVNRELLMQLVRATGYAGACAYKRSE